MFRPKDLKSDNSETGETGEMSETWQNVRKLAKCPKIGETETWRKFRNLILEILLEKIPRA